MRWLQETVGRMGAKTSLMDVLCAPIVTKFGIFLRIIRIYSNLFKADVLSALLIYMDRNRQSMNPNPAEKI